MARQTLKNFQAALKTPFKKRFGMTNSTVNTADHDFDNNYPIVWSDSTDTISVEGIRVDSDSKVRVDHAAVLGERQNVVFEVLANAEQGTQCFFIADRPYVIRAITEIHAVAATTAGTVTGAIYKCTGTQTPAGGSTTMVGTFDMKGAANTLQTATLLAINNDGTPNAGIVLSAGDRLSFVASTATLTSLAGVQVTVTLSPGFKSVLAPYYVKTNGRLAAAQSIFVANRPMTVVAAYACWSTAGTVNATIDVTKDTVTTVPGAGTSIGATANSIDATGTVNTVNSLTLTATAATLKLAAGDRLSVVLGGTLTTLAGVVVYVVLAPSYSRVDVSFSEDDVAAILTSSIFTADRDYEVMDSSASWRVISGTSGTIDFTIDRSTTAPGGGTSALSGAIDATATLNTPVAGALSTSPRAKWLSAGDRLAIKFAGTLNGLRGVVANVTLAPR